MKKHTTRKLAIAAALATAPLTSAAWAQLRVVSLNASNSTISTPFVPGPRDPWMSTILSSIGSTISDDPTLAGNTGIIKPIDVLALQEVDSATTTSAPYATLMNSLYPGANYQYATLNGLTTGAGTQGLVYNANAVQLISAVAVGVSSSSSQPRQALRYQLRPVGYDSSADVYLYNSHYKSSQGATEETRRNDEAVYIRTNADALGTNKNIIYLGDFNVYNSAEPMYVTLLASGNGKANDPINKPGWTGSNTYKNIHTQSPFSSTQATALGTGYSGASGGMDDRFDQQLVSTTMLDGDGLAYITNSYQAFGNNGTHTLNSSIYSGTNINTVAQYLSAVLDHLPVVADYQLPAKLGASVSIPSQVIVGGSVTVNLNVSNAAPVSYVVGADSLSYSYTSTGAASGSGSGTDAALGSTNNHTITLSTATVGAKSGNISVTSTSESVASNNFSQPVSYTVLDHADASFSPDTSSTAATIDFGYVPIGSATRTAPFEIANRALANRAALDLDAISNTGDTARLTTNASIFSNLAAGNANSYNASLNSAVVGNYSATHTFIVSDQNLPGATARPNLVLTTSSRVFSVASFPVTGFMYLPANEPLTTGTFAIGAGVTLTKTGPGAMTINGAQSNGAGSQLVMNGGVATFNTDAGPTGATLGLTVDPGAGFTFNATQHLASLSITEAAVNITPGGNKPLVTNTLSIDTDATLDLSDHTLVVRNGQLGSWTGSTYTDITGLVAQGRNQGAFDGSTGILTTQSDATTGSGYTTLAIATAQETGRSGLPFAGITLSATDILVMYTYGGDANLSGNVDVDDYGQIDFNAGIGGILTGWFNGDFDYSGVVDVDDYGIIDFVINIQGQPFPTGAGISVSTVPEPGTLGAVGMGLMFARRRRTRIS